MLLPLQETFQRALAASMDSCVEGPFSGVTSCGRVQRKVPESDARSARCMLCVMPSVFDGQHFITTGIIIVMTTLTAVVVATAVAAL